MDVFYNILKWKVLMYKVKHSSALNYQSEE